MDRDRDIVKKRRRDINSERISDKVRHKRGTKTMKGMEREKYTGMEQ